MIFTLLLAVLLQSSTQTPVQQAEPPVQNLLNAGEQRSLQRATTIQARTQVLLAAAGRHLKEAGQMLQNEKSQAMLDSLESYKQLLLSCEWHMHAKSPDKRLNLKKQEIELRRQLTLLDDLLAKGELDDKPAIEATIRMAKALRNHFLTTFFGKESLKP